MVALLTCQNVVNVVVVAAAAHGRCRPAQYPVLAAVGESQPGSSCRGVRPWTSWLRRVQTGTSAVAASAPCGRPAAEYGSADRLLLCRLHLARWSAWGGRLRDEPLRLLSGFVEGLSCRSSWLSLSWALSACCLA